MTRRQTEGERLELQVRSPRNASFRVERRGPVEVVSGVVAFGAIDFVAGVEGLDYAISGRLVLDDPPSRYVLDRFTVQRPGPDVDMPRDEGSSPLLSGQPVTATALRSVPLDFVVSQVCYAFAIEGGGFHGEVDGSFQGFVPAPRAELRDRGMGDKDALRQVAAVYLAASLRESTPLEWVAHYLDCSTPTASRWVAAAKDAGFLRVASRRRRA